MHLGRFLSLAAAQIMFVGSAHAYFYTGNDLHEQLKSGTSFGIGYVAGTIDGLEGTGTFRCVPDKVVAKQAAQVVLNFMDKNAAQWQQPASVLIFEALQ